MPSSRFSELHIPENAHHTFHFQFVAILCGRVSDYYSQLYEYTLTSWLTYLLSTWMSDARHSPYKAAYQI